MSADSRLDRVRGTVAGLRGGGRGWTLLAVAAGWLFTLGLRFTVPALLPAIREDFVVSDTAAGLAVTLLWVTYAATQFPAGALVDRVGERRLLAGSALGSAVSMGVFALAPAFGVFLVATAVYGVASGLYGPARGTALTRTYPDRDGAAFGAVLAAGSVGAALLPAAATYAAGLVGWRGALALTVPGFLVAALALSRVVPARPEPDDAGGSDPLSVRVRAGAGAIRRAVASRRVALAVAAVTLMLFAFQGLTAFYTTYLVTAKGLRPATAGALFGLLFLSGALAQSVGGALADRFGAGRVLGAVSLFGVVPLVALPYAEGLPALAVVSVLVGTRLAVAPVSNAYIVSLLPAAVRGTAWGVVRTGLFAVGAFGSTAVGALADLDRYPEAFLLLAALTGVAGLVYLALPERAPEGAGGAEADPDPTPTD